MKIAWKEAFASFFVVGTMMFSGPAFAQSVPCEKLNGEWAGTMTGRFQGPITMSVSNCKITWKLPDGRTNYCSYSNDGGKMTYQCSLGSRGTVVASSTRITMRNTFTGNNYVASFSKK